ncbi:MAG: GNAT family N-acetyltransferase [Clostridia bacterium]|nr:GNAT family N-acetyltransferase [Clostridia bacterium]
MSPAIGFAADGDRRSLAKLYRVCFPKDEPAFWDWIFRNPYRAENTLVIRNEDKVISSLQMIPCAMRLNGQRFAAHYIYAAATLPAYRGAGLMAGLLSEAAAIGRARGHAFSVLITQEDSLLTYYGRFGYLSVLCCERKRTGAGILLPDETVRRAEERDIPALNGLYEAACGNLLHGVRTPEHWRGQLELFPEGAYLLEHCGEAAAYCFSDERGCIEAVGKGSERLAGHLNGPGAEIQSPPCKEAVPMGCIRPLDPGAAAAVREARGYLNLMYN